MLKAIVKDLDEVPEALREHYRQDGERYVLSVEPSDGYALEDVQALKSTLRKERDRFNTAKGALEHLGASWSDEAKRWEGGVKTEDHDSALERVKELESIDPTKEADKLAEEKFKALQTQLAEKHRKEMEAILDREKATLSQLRDEMISMRAAQAIQSVNGSPVLQTLLEREADIREVDGVRQVVILDGDGQPRITQKGQGTGWMDFAERLDEMRGDDTYKPLFPARTTSGGGSTSTAAREAGRRVESGATIAATDRDAVSANLEGIADGKVKVAFNR